jgi:hypothetical protein
VVKSGPSSFFIIPIILIIVFLFPTPAADLKQITKA